MNQTTRLVLGCAGGAAIALLIAQTAHCQPAPAVNASLSIVDHRTCSQWIGKAANTTSCWTVVLENDSTEQVSVGESAVLKRIKQLNPRSAAAQGIVVDQGAATSKWTLAQNGTIDLAAAASYIMASKTITVPAAALTAATGVVALAPKVLDRLKGYSPPVRANFDTLAWRAPVMLGPGQSNTLYVFTSRWPDNSQAVEVSIPVGPMPLVKMAQ